MINASKVPFTPFYSMGLSQDGAECAIVFGLMIYCQFIVPKQQKKVLRQSE